MMKFLVLLVLVISLVAGKNHRGEALENQPALGRNVHLGGLYNARKHTFPVGMSLWTHKKIEEYKIRVDTEYSKTHYLVENNLFDRMATFKIDAEMSLDFLGGLIHVAGAANYLKKSKELESTIRYNLHFESTHHTERIEINLPKDELSFCGMTGEDAPTHVVSQVKYGLNAVFIFERDENKNNTDEDIGGSLQVVVRSIPSFDVSGKASIDIKGTTINETENTRIEFYGDILLTSQPTNVKEAAEVYREIGRKAISDPQIVSYSLTPISYYCKAEDILIYKISSSIRDEAIQIIHDIEQTELKIRTLKATDVAKRFLAIRRPLLIYENGLGKFKTNFMTELKLCLIEAKMNNSAGVGLSKLLQSYKDSEFETGSSQIKLSTIAREINTIDLVTGQESKGTYQVTDEEDGNDNACLFSYKFAIFYSLNVLGNSPSSIQKRWFNRNAQIGSSGEKFRAFLEFSKVNQESKSCFMVQLKEHSQQPVNIVAFKNGEILSNNFIIPHAPEQVTLITANVDHIQLGFEKIENKYITSIVLKYRSLADFSEDEWKQEEVNVNNGMDVYVNMIGLTPRTTYRLKMSFKTDVGVSPDSQEIEVKTRLSSPPSDILVKSLSQFSLQVLFQPPIEILPEIKKYVKYVVTLEEGPNLKMMVEKAPYIFDNLNPSTHFYISVQATYRKANYSEKEIIGYENYESRPATLNVTTIPQWIPTPRISSLSSKTAIISWDIPEVAIGAIINNFLVIYNRIDNNVKAERITLGDVTNFEIGGLAAGVLYEVSVQARTTAGNSLMSAGKQFTTPKVDTKKYTQGNTNMVVSDRKQLLIEGYSRMDEAFSRAETRFDQNKVDQYRDQLIAVEKHSGVKKFKYSYSAYAEFKRASPIAKEEQLFKMGQDVEQNLQLIFDVNEHVKMNRQFCNAETQQLKTFLRGYGVMRDSPYNVVDAPDIITVSSDDGPASELYHDRMGIYKRTDDLNGHPMWIDLNDNYKIFYSSGGRWMISTDPKSSSIPLDAIISVETGLKKLPGNGWQYWKGSNWTSATHLAATAGRPEYPESIQVSSTGPAADQHSECMGRYNKILGQEQGGRPMYKHSKHEDRMLFYADNYYWMINDNPKATSGWISSGKSGQVNIPETGWEYRNHGFWSQDPQLKVM